MDNQPNPPSFNTSTMVLIWLGLLAGASFFFNDVIDKINNPNQTIAVHINDNGSREIALKQNRQGHYIATGQINHQPVQFLLDTGATNVAIAEHLAKKLNLKKGAAHNTVTANGNSISYSTTLDSISLGGIEMHNVPASISQGMQFDEVLLGMSFLKHLKMSQHGKILTISVPDTNNTRQ